MSIASCIATWTLIAICDVVFGVKSRFAKLHLPHVTFAEIAGVHIMLHSFWYRPANIQPLK
jgi:hypothetical protein